MPEKILLNHILHLSPEEISVTKIRLNTHSGQTDPLDEFKKDPEILRHWNFYNTSKKNYNNTKYAIGFVDMKNGRWLLVTIAEITKDLNLLGQVGYEYKEIDEYKPLFGRLIIKYKNTSQNMVRYATGLIDELEVIEILSEEFTGEDFNGYENVRLSYGQLKTALARNNTYINAFRNQKAVYLITDTTNGKLYVGSATSEYGMLLSRWQTYIENGHGGNEGLKEIAFDPNRGFDYIQKHFQYSILENYNQRVSDDYVLSRESHWKKILLSRTYGYNKN